MADSPQQQLAPAERGASAPDAAASDSDAPSSGASSVDRRAYGMFRSLPTTVGGRDRGGGSDASESDAGSEYDAAVAYLASVR